MNYTNPLQRCPTSQAKGLRRKTPRPVMQAAWVRWGYRIVYKSVSQV